MSNYGESATIKTPEVGDIYGNDDYRYHVLFVSENAVRCITIVCGIHPCIMVWDRDLFIKQFNCIGKSKGSIDDLFEV